MGLRDMFKRKMPATFNAAEYETERILSRIDQCAGQSDEIAQLVNSVQESLDSLSERITQPDESMQLLKSVSEKIDALSAVVTQQKETARLLHDIKESADLLSKCFAQPDGTTPLLQSVIERLDLLSENAVQSDETTRLLKGVLEKVEPLPELLVRSNETTQLLKKVIEKTDLFSERFVQLEETAQQLKDTQEQIDMISKHLAHLKGDLHWRMDRIEKIGVRHTPWSTLSFEVALAEHCNLKCAGCDHFSPVAEPEFADIEEFTRDCERLSELFSGSAREIHLLGGEPLLHPDITSFLKTARRCFPGAVIDITTNGMLLPKMGAVFWNTCHEEKIVIRPTKYPVEEIDYKAAERLAEQFGVEYRYIDDTGRTVKTLTKYPLDLKGTQDPRRSFMLCHRANACIMLAHGRLFTCTVAPSIYHLNRYFGTCFEENPRDSVDIYKVSSVEEILDYLAHPIPFCRYCMPECAQEGQPWRNSKRELSEWV